MDNQSRVTMVGIEKSFPGVHALQGVDFTVMPHQIHGLLGENGAGKSVLLKILLGVYRADGGKITLNGEDITDNSPLKARNSGLSAVYQDLQLVESLSVAENICLGWQPNSHGFLDRKKMYETASDILEKYGLSLDLKKRVSTLSVAKKQMVAIAKALALNSQVLVLDEPTAMLTDEETEILFNAMRRLKNEDVSIIYVSHRLEEIYEICDWVTVMRDGKHVGSYPVEEVDNDKLISMMSGRKIENLYGDEKGSSEDRIQPGTPILEVKGLTRAKAFHDISFSVSRGEIVGMFGLVGAGRTETMRAIFGADPYDSGEIHVDGKPLTDKGIRSAMKAGIALVPEDRHNEGVAQRMAVYSNINMANYQAVTKYFLASERKEKEIAEAYREKLQIKTPSLDQKVRNLSGGNQQKVAVAKWFNITPKVMIFDEPTVGVDVGAKVEIYEMIRSFAADGGGVIMVSSYLPELIGVCDRIIVMSNGRITGEFLSREATQEAILSKAFES
ncbi:MAG: sugar ABC transporter ATP-binding protein [Lachnospiraceae bacterium]|nr:sugar ABC transporter ATP-binding protein [Lachnospiraceae bacterium]